MSHLNIRHIKLEEFNPEMFANKHSYTRFIKGFERAKEIQAMKEAGYIIFIEGEALKPNENFVVSTYDKSQPCYGIGEEHTMTVLVGHTFCPDTGRIWVEKEDLDIFNEVSYVQPSKIKKMKKLK